MSLTLLEKKLEMIYIHNELCRLHRRSDGYTELTNISWHRQNTYIPTKSVEDVQLIPTIRYTRTLALCMNLIWQNFRIEANEDIAMMAIADDEMLRNVQ